MSEKNRKLRIAFVGAGAMGQAAHLRNYASLDDCEVVALAEVREDLGRRVAAKYGIPKVYPDAATLLARERPDAIVASQQFSRHGIVVGELLKAGVPLFIEKPLAASLTVGERLAAADREAGGKLMIGYHKRSDPATICAKAEIDRLKQTEELGQMRYLRVTMPPGDWIAHGFFDTLLDSAATAPADVDPPDADLDAESAKAYFTFVNFYIHQINLIRHLIGEDYRLSYVDPVGVVIVGHGSVSGIPVTLETSPYATASDWQETVLAAFERGHVSLSLPAPLALNRPGALEIYRDPGAGSGSTLPPYPIRFRHSLSQGSHSSHWSNASTLIPKLPNDHAMRVQAANFLRFVRGEAPPTCGSAEALEDLRIARAWLKLSRGA